jgi:hypothetical protein
MTAESRKSLATIVRKRRVKNVSAARNKHSRIQESLEGVFSMLSVSSLYKADASRNHVAFKLPYVYDYITKLCSTQAEVIQNHINPNVHGIGQGEARHGKHKRLKLGCGQANDR